MTVSELISRLQEFPEDLPIALCLFGRCYSSANHVDSHGELTLTAGKSNGCPASVFLSNGDPGKRVERL